ncbi:Gfo/Idh/MocA family oxidoreductase [Flavobacterium sp. J27]|uniref:Gfo/Idh/MocA family oxidoreductase n=1 Tax=Flavobacterium sp. J27 TaxID=2060419 RepID=UPI00102FD338|nr:Gfo/Idh/MocA family oxidoreductase [Flavobacterium sp. J27]
MKIKTGLLAYGASGKLFHAPFIEAHHNYELVGAWERSNQNIEHDYPKTVSFNTFEAILNSDAELIVVNTPIDTHYEFTKKVLEAGKHALVEKAFTTTSQEAEELHKLAQKNNVKLCVYQNRRYDSDFTTVKKVLDEQHLGDIVEAEIRFERYNPQLSAKAWKENGNPGTGLLMDLGSHIIDQALVLFGLPKKLFADVRKTRDNSKIDDYFDILLFYPEKRVRLKASLLVKELAPSYVLHGKKGSFLKHRGDIQEDQLKLGKKPNRADWGTEPNELDGLLVTHNLKGIYPTLAGNYLHFYDDLYEAISKDKKVPATALEAFNTTRIIELAKESSQNQKVVLV